MITRRSSSPRPKDEKKMDGKLCLHPQIAWYEMISDEQSHHFIQRSFLRGHLSSQDAENGLVHSPARVKMGKHERHLCNQTKGLIQGDAANRDTPKDWLGVRVGALGIYTSAYCLHLGCTPKSEEGSSKRQQGATGKRLDPSRLCGTGQQSMHMERFETFQATIEGWSVIILRYFLRKVAGGIQTCHSP